MTNDILEIKKYPDEALRKRSRLVKAITATDLELLENMVLTMRAFRGIGLAAPQVGLRRQLIVADTGEGIIKLANPEILEAKGNDLLAEGCLSVPDVNVKIERPFKALVRGLNEKGKTIEIKARGLLARVLQHEIDHLKGKLIIDYINPSQKGLLTSKLKSRLIGDRPKRHGDPSVKRL